MGIKKNFNSVLQQNESSLKSRSRTKSTAVRRAPFTPRVSNKNEAHSYSSWKAWTSPPPMLKLLRIYHRPACQTLSNAFLKSIKLWNSWRWCCGCLCLMIRLLKICSTVLRSGLKFAFSSASSSSALGLESVDDNSEHDVAGMVDLWCCMFTVN